MPNLRAQLATALKRVDAEIKASIKVAAEGVAEGMVKESTVDTGLFAVNWQPTTNAKNTDDLWHTDFGVDPLALDYPNDRQISEAEALEIAQNIPDFALGDEIIWTNSVPYLKDFDSASDLVAGAEHGKDLAKARVEK